MFVLGISERMIRFVWKMYVPMLRIARTPIPGLCISSRMAKNTLRPLRNARDYPWNKHFFQKDSVETEINGNGNENGRLIPDQTRRGSRRYRVSDYVASSVQLIRGDPATL